MQRFAQFGHALAKFLLSLGIPQRGIAATKGARLCPQDQPQRAGTAQKVAVKPESMAVSTCCGLCSAHSPRSEKSSQLATISTDSDTDGSQWQGS